MIAPSKKFTTTILLLAFSNLFIIISTTAQPAFYLDKLDTPDLTQTDPRGDFAQNGINYCAPAAVSNSFAWLSNHGYPKLLPELRNSRKNDYVSRQILLTKILSSPTYMNTKGDEGTYVNDVLLGIRKYILDQGYSVKQLTYQGFRSNLPEFDIGIRAPRIELLRQGLTGHSGVWLNIGWYKFNSSSQTYVRQGGHWVTLVGYGKDKKGNLDNNIFVIHNPSPRAGMLFHNDYIALQPLKGVLVSRRGLMGFPRPAWGFYKIVGDISPVPGSDTVILESAVILDLY